MLHLILDCSGPHSHWVLAENNGVMDEVRSENRFDAAEKTLDLLQILLDKHSLSSKQIMSYAYISGPGSFTGLRIAAATIKALTFANDLQNIVALDPCKLYAEQYATNHSLNKGILIPVIASRKNHVYHCSYQHEENTLSLISPVQEQSIDSLYAYSFGSMDSIPKVFLGSDCLLLKHLDCFEEHDLQSLSAQTMVSASYSCIVEKKFVDKASFDPNYVVQSVAKPKNKG